MFESDFIYYGRHYSSISCLYFMPRYKISCKKLMKTNMVWSINYSGKVLNKSKMLASSLPTYDFSLLNTSLPNNLIK